VTLTPHSLLVPWS